MSCVNAIFQVMDNILFFSILLSASAFTKGDDYTTPTAVDENGDSFPHAIVSSSVGSLLLIVLFAYLFYYCFVRKTTPEGFSRFNNDIEGNPQRRRFRWRNRRFWRNRHQNYVQNTVEPRHSVHVSIQPVVTLGISSENQDTEVQTRSGRVPNMPTAPPAYDESMNNQPLPNQFLNPPMSNQFINPTVLNRCINPHMPNNFNNSPIPSNFNSPPMSGNFNNPPMSSGSNNLSTKNPNASSYHSK